ncbi:AAA family ATPase [Paenibacillus sp. FSL W7-1279]|uniref:AAA family ATPase n=1 Tax=unclassified Paenibacillus TaxID=185978 RepID=UPI0030CD97AC
MIFVLIFGPQAVGKMTVGQELEKITGLKLFHNHMSIEFVTPFFSYSTAPGKRLVRLIRKAIFEEVANSDLNGLIFTFLWSFDSLADWEYVDEVCHIFESKGGVVCFVELEADNDIRLERNKSPNRLEHKPTKRDIDFSEGNLLNSMAQHRLNTLDGEIKRENYMKINNAALKPEEVASMIKQRFKL